MARSLVPWFVFSNVFLLTAFWVICFVFFGDPRFSHWSIFLLVFGLSFHLASGLFIGSYPRDFSSSCALFGIPPTISAFCIVCIITFLVAPSPISFGQHSLHSFLCYRNCFRFCTIPTIVMFPANPFPFHHTYVTFRIVRAYILPWR